MPSDSSNYREKYIEARKKAESTVDSFLKECKNNGFTLKEIEILSEIFSERIQTEIERTKYVTAIR